MFFPITNEEVIFHMNKSLIISLPVVALSLLGCSSASSIASNAADTAACNAISSYLPLLSESYQAGLIDSNLVDQVEAVLNSGGEGLLSPELSQDLNGIVEVLRQSPDTAQSQADLNDLIASTTQRCSDVGISIGQ